MKTSCFLLILSILISQSLATVYTRAEVNAMEHFFNQKQRQTIASEIEAFLRSYAESQKTVESKIHDNKNNKKQKQKTPTSDLEKEKENWKNFIQSLKDKTKIIRAGTQGLSQIELSSYFDSIVEFQKFLSIKNKLFASQIQNMNEGLGLKVLIDNVRTYQPEVEAKKRVRKIENESSLRIQRKTPSEIFRETELIIEKNAANRIEKQSTRNKYAHLSRAAKNKEKAQVESFNKVYNTPAQGYEVETIEPVKIPTIESPKEEAKVESTDTVYNTPAQGYEVKTIEPVKIPTLKPPKEEKRLIVPEVESGKKARIIVVKVVDEKNCNTRPVIAKYMSKTD